MQRPVIAFRALAGQLTVKWTDEEQIRLHYLRASMVQNEDLLSELRFIKVATLQMKTGLYARLQISIPRP